ncbi:DEAD/DEAH box helicase [Caulobacter sp. S45]|uniref:DEAD/DEAH box helicase n=1 Tax=Caulobacter sp. S45 TaxID=1641861 RepID=UPI00131C0020|nr:ATP-binding protein [Caulobacter sp. S45]
MNFAGRPYAQLGIAELERLVQDAPDRRSTNEAILAELRYRKVARAQALQKRLEEMLASADAVVTPPVSAPSNSFGPSPTIPLPISRPAAPLPERETIANDPQDILRAWTVLEVLSPATFRKPADLAGGDVRRIARFDRGLPWADGTAKGPPGARLYFQIVLGSVVMQPAIDGLLQRFADNRPERPQARGETPLAVIIVDREGRPIPDACAVVSSFGWGLPQALAGDPASLGRWSEEEDRIQTALHELLYRESEDGKALPLDETAITSAWRWLVGTFGLDDAMLKPSSFAVRSTVPFKSSEPPEPLLLNSFFLKDIGKAIALFAKNEAPNTLKRFLGAMPPETRRDLLHDEEAIETVVAPARFPSGRWPGPGRHPLVLMQQAAVNLATAQRPGEILAVNGPPGTGKTTLLRDVVAALVTTRAGVMAAFDDPEKAFAASGAKLNLGGAWIHLYRLDPRLKGFEMLVASSNNKAVENVSGELPAIGAVADDAPGLRYFKPMADGLLGQESWGAIAAVLGNAGNRSAFKDRFWWTEDTGLFSYFKAIDGRKPEISLPDGSKRPPRIVSDLDPPLDHRAALRRWQAARTRFLALEKQVAATRERVELFRQRYRYLPALERVFEAVRAHGAERPGLIQRLLGLRRYRAWKREHDPLSSALASVGTQAADAKLLPSGLPQRLTRSPWLGFHAEVHAAEIDALLAPMLVDWRREREARQATAIDDAFFETGAERIQPSAPWFTAGEHRERDALFEAALDLHRAFVDAAAKPLRQNLGAALQVLDGKGLGEPTKDALIPDLWSSLFLVVPAMSTTFASVGTMLGRLSPASLGWLLVDEAGQASPQQAVGAIMRAGRAIVVGDPIQVPPVVMLPDRLTNAICRTFGVDPGRFSAPAASVQTLADDATAWFAEFPARMGSRTVGVPLLVHRRCSEPMFSIANRVAYENLMVQAKVAKPSPIRDLLGPSCWIDVIGSGADKWCAEEGREAVDMIERVVAAGLKPDLYVVTPFVQVADGLRRMIRESPVLGSAIPDLDRWRYERVGTIHTVQGREAEVVIFVLGAPNADQTGARAWAGKEPNLLNVAVTRAKETVYVVGNRGLWRSAGVFAQLDAALE